MAILYEKLHKILKKRAITVEDMADAISLEDSSITKIKNNHMISNDDIKNICNYLDLEPTDLYTLTDKYVSKKFETLIDDMMYHVKLFYIETISSNSSEKFCIEYLYGYSIPSILQSIKHDHNTWHLKRLHSDNKYSVYQLSAILPGCLLQTFIESIVMHNHIKNYTKANLSSIRKTPRNSHSKDVFSKILLTPIFDKNSILYTSPSYLIPKNVSHKIIFGHQPSSSFNNTLFVKETLSSPLKSEIYKNETNIIQSKQDFIFSVFKDYICINSSNSQIPNLIGNFESIVMPLYKTIPNTNFLNIDSKYKKDNNTDGYIYGYDITLKHEILQGQYLLEIITYLDDNNILTDTVHPINLSDKDIQQTIFISEDLSTIQVKLFDLNNTCKLIYLNEVSFLRRIHTTQHISNGILTLGIHDTKNHATKPETINYYTTIENKIGDFNNPKTNLHDSISRDFSRYVYSSNSMENLFIPAHSEENIFLIG